MHRVPSGRGVSCWFAWKDAAGERRGEESMVDWELHGSEFGNCNCGYGCPCQFNALPSKGYCQAIVFVKIDKGHFGEAKLDGLNLAFAVAWPGAVHEGHG